jgi:nucleotide-binding universal stress UspA family protein
VPLDGSPVAARVLPAAAWLARGLGAPITVLHARADGEPLDQATAAVATAAAHLSELGVTAAGAVVTDRPVDAILAEAATWDAAMIVLATHGRGGLDRLVHGSVAAEVLHRSTVPVFLVRTWPEAPPAPDPGERPLLLVPLDESPFAEAALPVARRLAGRLGAALRLVSVVSQPRAYLEAASLSGAALPAADVVAAEEEDATAYLRARVERLRAEGLSATAEVRVGNAAEEIAEEARSCRASAVVMSTHGRTGVARGVLGSVADAVLRHGRCPLLLVRPEGTGRPG